ncbi:DNA topoisomerase 3-alpha [Bienertia sinuspersici]
MSSRRQGSNTSGSSSNSKRASKVKCKCGNDDIMRTIKNGVNVGSKFYGCPLWPVWV